MLYSYFFFLMILRPPRSTRTDTLFPSRRSSDLAMEHAHPVRTVQPGGDRGQQRQQIRFGERFAVVEHLRQRCAWLEVHDQIGGAVDFEAVANVRSGERLAPWPRHLRHGPSERQRLCLPDIRVCRKRTEEHTSELQSLMRISYAVFCLKKKI